MTVVFALCKCRSAEAFSLTIKMKVYKRCDFNRELHIFYFIFIFLLNSRVGIAMGKFANEVNNCGRRSQGNIWVVLMGVPHGSLRLKWIGRRTYLISIWWCHSTYKCLIFVVVVVVVITWVLICCRYYELILIFRQCRTFYQWMEIDHSRLRIGFRLAAQ